MVRPIRLTRVAWSAAWGSRRMSATSDPRAAPIQSEGPHVRIGPTVNDSISFRMPCSVKCALGLDSSGDKSPEVLRHLWRAPSVMLLSFHWQNKPKYSSTQRYSLPCTSIFSVDCPGRRDAHTCRGATIPGFLASKCSGSLIPRQSPNPAHSSFYLIPACWPRSPQTPCRASS